MKKVLLLLLFSSCTLPISAQYIQLTEGTPFPLKTGYAIPLSTGKQLFQTLEAARTWHHTRDSLTRAINRQKAEIKTFQKATDSLKAEIVRIKIWVQNDLQTQQSQFDRERAEWNEKMKKIEQLNELLMATLDKKRAKQIHNIITPHR